MMPEYENKDALKDHQPISEFKKTIENLPNIKTWIEKRPKTPFQKWQQLPHKKDVANKKVQCTL